MYYLGVPDWILQGFHILFGLYLAYVGYYKQMNKDISMTFVVLGVLAVLYHIHISYLKYFKGMEYFMNYLKSGYVDSKYTNSGIKRQGKGSMSADIKNPRQE